MRGPLNGIIAVSPTLHERGPGEYQSLEREVRRSMERKGGTVRSASGMTAALAINHCERNGLSYRVTATAVLPGGNMSYFVERIEEGK